MTKEEELVKDGWEKKFVADEPRLSEMVELYESLDLEVLLEPLPPKESLEKKECTASASNCTVCFDEKRDRYRIIYTRPKGPVRT